MRQRIACLLLATGGAAVALACAVAPPPLVETGPATLERLLPRAALLRFEGGAFAVVPRSALGADLLPGGAVDLRLAPPGDRRLAAAPSTNPAARAERTARTW